MPNITLEPTGLIWVVLAGVAEPEAQRGRSKASAPRKRAWSVCI